MERLGFDLEDIGGVAFDADEITDFSCDDIRPAWLSSRLLAERAALACGFEAIWIDR